MHGRPEEERHGAPPVFPAGGARPCKHPVPSAAPPGPPVTVSGALHPVLVLRMGGSGAVRPRPPSGPRPRPQARAPPTGRSRPVLRSQFPAPLRAPGTAVWCDAPKLRLTRRPSWTVAPVAADVLPGPLHWREKGGPATWGTRGRGRADRVSSPAPEARAARRRAEPRRPVRVQRPARPAAARGPVLGPVREPGLRLAGLRHGWEPSRYSRFSGPRSGCPGRGSPHVPEGRLGFPTPQAAAARADRAPPSGSERPPEPTAAHTAPAPAPAPARRLRA